MPRIYADPPDALSRRVPGLFLATLIVLWLTTGSGPIAVSSILFNISGTQYETALAKWNSLHVAEYEETVRYPSSMRWKIVVDVDRTAGSTKENVTHLERLDGT